MALPELYQEKEFQRQTFDRNSEFMKRNPNLTARGTRKFNRYWNSDQRLEDEKAFNAAQDAAEAAFVQGEIDKRAASWDARIAALREQNKARGEEALKKINASLASKPAITPTPPTPPVKPAVVPLSNTEWNRIAKENGFADMGEVLAWQEANGLEADGKFGNASAAFFKANGLGKYQKTPEGYVELSRPDGTTFLQRTGTFNTGNSTSTPTPTPSTPAKKPKKKNSWFANATMAAAMADAPAVMTASGWRQNEAGDYVQDREDDPGVERLRNNLAVLGGTATGVTTAGLMTAGAAGTAAIAAPEATPLLTGPAAKHVLYDAAGKMLMAYKQGGTMNRINYFQQGGAAPQQDIKAQITALIQAAMQGDQKATQQVNQIMEAAKAGDQQAIQIAQIMEQVVKEMQGQAVAAKYGAKLDYLQSLKCGGKAKAKKKEQGGKVCPACEQGKQTKKPIITKHQYGGSFYRNWSPEDVKKLQLFLAGYNGYEGNTDGAVTTDFIENVKAYQRANGFKDDGMWGYNTNQVHRVLDSDILKKGSYKSTHKTEQGNLVAHPTDFTYATMQDFSPAEIQKVINYYSVNPDLLYSDDMEHSKWRQVFHNSGKDGADFLNQIAGSLTEEERANIDPKKLTTQYKTDALVSKVNARRNQAAEQLLPALVAPVALGGLTTVATGGAGLAGVTGLLGSVGGAEAGRRIGKKVGRKRGEDRKDETYVDPVAERYGVASSVHDPNRRIAEGEQVGETVGNLVGGVTGGAVGSLAGAGIQANVYNVMGQGRANMGYRGVPQTAQPSTAPYGTTTPPQVNGVSNAQLFKAGLGPANHAPGRTRLGGTYGTRFNFNGQTYNAGTPASPEVIEAASTYYNNPASPIRINFGGNMGTNPGVKLGRAYDINVPGALGVGAMVTPASVIAGDAVRDTQPSHPARKQKRSDKKEERKEKRQERHKKLISRTAESTTD